MSYRRYLFFVAPEFARADVLRFGVSREVVATMGQSKPVLYPTRKDAEASTKRRSFDVFMVDCQDVHLEPHGRGGYAPRLNLESWRVRYVTNVVRAAAPRLKSA